MNCKNFQQLFLLVVKMQTLAIFFVERLNLISGPAASGASGLRTVWKICFLTRRQKTEQVREDIIGKSTFSFGHCPKRGGGLPMPEFFGPFFTKLKSL